MKTKSLSRRIAYCMFFLVGCFASSLSQAFELKKADGIEIKISPMPNIPQESPRMPANNPFYAEEDNLSVLLGSYSNCGIVDVSLTSTAGDDYSTVFDTSAGTIIIPISGLTGDYTLLITTLAGVEFIGEFSI